MISDILSDAISEIGKYQKEVSHSYEEIEPEIRSLMAHMQAILNFLDTPPSQDAEQIFLKKIRAMENSDEVLYYAKPLLKHLVQEASEPPKDIKQKK